MEQRIDHIFTKFASKVALIFDNEGITYGELERKVALVVNKITIYGETPSLKTSELIPEGETPSLKTSELIPEGETQIPITFSHGRGIDSIVAMLAIIKAKCYYVPLDPNYPSERISHITQDIGPHFDLHRDFSVNILTGNPSAKDVGVNPQRGNPSAKDVRVSPRWGKFNQYDVPVAYIIYTSGSTGLPKGVIITQSSLMNLVDSAIKICQLNEDSRILHYTSIGFDAAGWDIYLSFFSGATLCIASDEHAINPPLCHQFMIDHKVTMATVTPSFLSQMPLQEIPSLKVLTVMGELSDMKYMNWWSKRTNVYNGYGPTECTIGSTMHHYHEGDSSNNIGFPFDGYTVHILDDNLEATREGQICIGGKGLSLGYYNLPEKTKEKFIESEFGRIYLTGDLGRKLPNGEIEIIGRMDNQVKINGIRVELEEIEQLAMQIKEIERACCVHHLNKIHLFYQSNQNISSHVIRSHLKSHLHRSVVPVTYTQVKKFELSCHGKTDRKILIDFIPTNKVNDSYSNPIEKIICQAYSHVLNVTAASSSNYFEMGGDSLKIHLILSILREHSINIRAIDVMAYPIISDLAKFVEKNAFLIPNKKSIESIQNGFHPVTPFQYNLWKHHQVNPQDTSYNTLRIYEFNHTNVDLIQKNLSQMIKRHPALRTRYVYQSDKLSQRFDDIIMINVKTGILDIKMDIEASLNTPFNQEDQLIRINIYPSDDKIILALIKDGSICDAYSEKIIDAELNYTWETSSLKTKRLIPQGETSSLKTKRLIPQGEPKDDLFLNFIDDVNVTSPNTFWESYLTGRFYHPIPNFLTLEVNHIRKKIPINLSETASYNKTTPFVLALSALGLMLQKYTNHDEVIVGTQFSLRDDPQYMNTVGFLVSTLLIRLDLKSPEYIKAVHELYLKVHQHKIVTYEKLMELWGNPVEVMFVYQNMVGIPSDELCNKPPFPVTWYVYESPNELIVDIKTYYNPRMIDQMVDMFADFLNDQKPSFNTILKGDVMEIPEKNIGRIIDDICWKYPFGTAIKYSSDFSDCLDKEISYKNLQEMINRSAHHLVTTYGIGINSCVAISLRKSVDFVITLLSILKIGAHYAPVDPDYPEERIQYMVADCCPQLIITRDSYKINFNHGCVIDMDQFNLDSQNIPNVNITDFSPCGVNDTIAYIIYTSGSTGNPKACIITHKSIINVCQFFKNRLDVRTSDRVWTHTTISFDIMVLELLLPLFTGAILMICPQCVSSNPVEHVKWINHHQPTIIQATPTQFTMIGKHLNNFPMKLLVGGEQLNNNLAATLLAKTKELYNVYGPSETCVWSTVKKIKNGVNIGKPIANTICMVNVPEYVTGELLIGGAGVANGYYNKPDITAERFIKIDGQIFYKTGDLVRIVNGEIEYVGRNDFQVKIRGHRVELEEIIKVADSYPDIIRSCIRVFQEPQISIVLYLISSISVIIESMYDYLRKKLPGQSIPSFIIQLPRFPETLNGKIDTKLLPNPYTNSLVRYTYHKKYVPPRNDVEKKISDIFCEVLNLTEISVDESVLNVGFTSINVFPTIIRIEKEFGVKMSGEEIYQYSTIESCALFLSKK